MNSQRGSFAAGASVLVFLLSLSLLAPSASALSLGLLVAKDHYETTTANVPITVNVLAGDSCILRGLPCPGGMKVVSVSKPSHGTAVINPDYKVTYTPVLGFVGSDSFTYTAT